jgi:hypothetical protein
MSSSGIFRRMVLIRRDVSEEHIASISRVTRICELGTTLAVTRNRSTLRRNTIYYSIVFLRSVLRLRVTANVLPSLTNLVTLMMEAIRSSESSALTRDTHRSIPEFDCLYGENIISF